MNSSEVWKRRRARWAAFKAGQSQAQTPRTHVSEFGHRWRVEVPRDAIKHALGRIHCETPDADVIDKVILGISTSDQRESYTRTIARQTIRYALHVHHRNRALYRRITSGGI
ncbi:hypothetical protein UFOVP823_11 [uncultured Caudovirales phage]|uniref:Uncharacterized protein n=1 Tax=uncultured Caudovirales phage TaxID=2100421 RepID=A0A6J5P7V6_9CAUD|nr:hypothetical protein UFOVP823_11 [uncultured Caudovirales phage]